MRVAMVPPRSSTAFWVNKLRLCSSIFDRLVILTNSPNTGLSKDLKRSGHMTPIARRLTISWEE